MGSELLEWQKIARLTIGSCSYDNLQKCTSSAPREKKKQFSFVIRTFFNTFAGRYF